MQDTKLVVVASSALTRGGIQSLVGKAEMPMTVVGTFADLQSADRFMKDERVNVLIIDDSLPRALDIGRWIKRILTNHPGLAVLMIGSRPTGSLIKRLLDNGARGFLHKNDDHDNSLIDAISVVRKGGMYLSPGASRLLKVQRPKPNTISERDLDVLQLTADGFEVKEISAHLGLSDKTIYRIQAALREIYNAQNNANLIDIAHQLKLFAHGELTDHDPN